MPESPASPNGKVLGLVLTEFHQKFLPVSQNGGGGDASTSISDPEAAPQLERLLKQNNINLAKKFIRQAEWPPSHPVRRILWTRLCKRLTADSDFSQSAQQYRATLPDVYGGKLDGSSRGIPTAVFVEATMTPNYYLNAEGCYRCQQILAMIEANQPQITYAPLLYPLTSLFLHFVDDNAEVFACLDALLRPRRVAKKFMSDTVHSCKSASHTMAELVRIRLKGIYNFILHSLGGKDPDEFFGNWLKWIFVDLPFQVVIRIVDCYLYEGMKVLFRTGLALLKLYHRSTGQPHSIPNLAQDLSKFCQNFLQHSSTVELLKIGFSFPRLSQQHLIRMIQQYEEGIRNAPTKDYKNAEFRRSISVPLPFIPSEVANMSSILKEDQLYVLVQWLPMRHRIAQPTLLFTSEEHGTSLVTFFQQTGHHEPTLLLIKTRNDDIFGAFCSHSWENRFLGGKNLSYFGTGESFLFTLHPEKKLYPWVGLGRSEIPPAGSSLFMAGDSSTLIIGGGGGFAIRFVSDLSKGRTQACATFANPPLSGASGGDFECVVVEAFGFVT